MIVIRLAFYSAILLLLFDFIIYFYPYLITKLAFNVHDADLKLLLVADPQIQGDAVLNAKGPYLGISDILFNDFYMKHLFTFVSWAFQPNYTVILGDLFSYQMLDDDEFNRRAKRFKWIFEPATEHTQLYALAGNHDIGYGFDMSPDRIERFESVFNMTNHIVEYGNYSLVFINAMLLDEVSPAVEAYRNSTWSFIEETAQKTRGQNVILFSHVPLYKPEGFCVDDPSINRVASNAVLSQNMISKYHSGKLLDLLKPIFVFGGHDHEGCHTIHSQHPDGDGNYRHYPVTKSDVFLFPFTSSLRQDEVHEWTVRSIMAEFSGNIGLVVVKGQEFTFIPFRYINHIAVWTLFALNTIAFIALFVVIQVSRRRYKKSPRPKKE